MLTDSLAGTIIKYNRVPIIESLGSRWLTFRILSIHRLIRKTALRIFSRIRSLTIKTPSILTCLEEEEESSNTKIAIYAYKITAISHTNRTRVVFISPWTRASAIWRREGARSWRAMNPLWGRILMITCKRSNRQMPTSLRPLHEALPYNYRSNHIP